MFSLLSNHLWDREEGLAVADKKDETDDRWTTDERVVMGGVRLVDRCNPNPPVQIGYYKLGTDLKECYAKKENIFRLYPVLKSTLNPDVYAAFFSALLTLEELTMDQDVKVHAMTCATMTHCDKYLCLKVPGLSEGRPSVVVGDTVTVVDKMDKGEICFEGCVHRVRDKDTLLLRFLPYFHESYANGDSVHVVFGYPRARLRRCHHAVGVAMKVLGKSILFPTCTVMRNPQCSVHSAHLSGSSVYRGGRHFDVIKVRAPKRLARPCSVDDAASQRKKDAPFFTVPRSDAVQAEGMARVAVFNTCLNSMQKLGVTRILQGRCRPTPYLCMGPPGTGKTATLVETVLQLHTRLPQSRILMCTPSNSAADLLVERLHRSGVVEKEDMVRLNPFHRPSSDVAPCIKRYFVDDSDLFAAAARRIVVCTCSTAGRLYSLGLEAGHFSHVFVDQAAQATEPETLLCIGMANTDNSQIVLVGDPMQCGPTVSSSAARDLGLGQSLMERLMKTRVYQRGDDGEYDPHLVTALIDNYRSHPDLVALPSRLFYDNASRSCVDVATLKHRSVCLPNSETRFPIMFYGVQGECVKNGSSPSWCNPAEVQRVVMCVKDLLGCRRCNVRESEIGIITPYRKQVELLRRCLKAVDVTDTKVGSVEEFQGGERRVIIVSTVRSTVSLTGHGLGFVADRKRFNVTITRPRAFLIVVGDPHLLERDTHWGELLRMCVKQCAYVTC